MSYSCDEAYKIISDTPRHIPPFLWGPTGIGKTHTVYRLGEELHLPVKVLIMAIRNPIDLAGLPTVNAERTRAVFLPPKFLPHVDEDGPEGILFLDEWNTAPKSVQAAGYQLVQEGRVGDYVMPKGWRMIAAGNRMGDKGLTETMAIPLANRFSHIEVHPDKASWLIWGAKHGIHYLVSAYIAFVGNEGLHKVSESAESPAFPTPRGWERVSDAINQIGVEHDGRWLPVVSSIVGTGSATAFHGFVESAAELPDLAKLLDGTATFKCKREPGIMYAYAMGLADHMDMTGKNRKSNDDKCGRYFDLIADLPEEYQVVSAQQVASNPKSQEVLLTQPASKWTAKHKDSLILN